MLIPRKNEDNSWSLWSTDDDAGDEGERVKTYHRPLAWLKVAIGWFTYRPKR